MWIIFLSFSALVESDPISIDIEKNVNFAKSSTRCSKTSSSGLRYQLAKNELLNCWGKTEIMRDVMMGRSLDLEHVRDATAVCNFQETS